MPSLPDEVAWLDAQADQMTALVARLASVSSYSHDPAGLDNMAAALRGVFAALRPDEIQTIDLPPARSVGADGEDVEKPLGQLLRFAKRPGAPRKALLVIHYDTVYPPDHPFREITRLDAHHLRGPGVADAKGGIVVLLHALLALERSPRARELGWEVLLNPDEEIGSPGSAPHLVEAARGADLALVFEPGLPMTGMVTQRKGSGNFSLVVRGRSAHAGRDISAGRNAVLAAARFALAATAAVSAVGPAVTINVSRIDGGSPPNVVPDLAVARFNVRVNAPDEQHEVERRLADLVNDVNAQDGISAELHGHFSAPPWVMDDRSLEFFEHVRACGRDLGLALEATRSGGASDANKIAAAGVPTVDSLGPVGYDIHSPQERVDVRTLPERAKLAALALMTKC